MAKLYVFLPQVKIMIDYLINTHSTIEDWEKFGENEVEWAAEAETR